MAGQFVSMSGAEVRQILMNARRVCRVEYLRKPWWVLAHDLFALGSMSSEELCRRAGLDPHDTPAIQKKPLPGNAPTSQENMK